jgi:hypothetical protein
MAANETPTSDSREFPADTAVDLDAALDGVAAGGVEPDGVTPPGGAISFGPPAGGTPTAGGAPPAGGPPAGGTALPLALGSSPLGAPASLGAFPSSPLGAFPSSPLGAFPSSPLGAFPASPLAAFPSSPLGAPAPLGAFPSTPLGAFPASPLAAFPSSPLGAPASLGAFPSSPAGGAGGAAGVPGPLLLHNELFIYSSIKIFLFIFFFSEKTTYCAATQAINTMRIIRRKIIHLLNFIFYNLFMSVIIEKVSCIY